MTESIWDQAKIEETFAKHVSAWPELSGDELENFARDYMSPAEIAAEVAIEAASKEVKE